MDGAIGRRSPGTPLAATGALLVALATVGSDAVVSALMFCLTVVFLVFFVRHLAFALSAVNRAPAQLATPAAVWYQPPVTVLVACRNEEPVVDRLITNLLALDYPRDRLQILVVDDGSTDGTGSALDRWAAREPSVHVKHRSGGRPGKSAALNAAMPHITGEIVVVFDADHRPRSDVLRLLARHFADPAVGAVQGRCQVMNAADAPIARLVAVDYLAGYLVNEFGRQSLFELPAYGGANCAVRTSALRALGGWNPGSVTEDTDLTMRLVLGGSRVRYDVHAVDEEEGVVTLSRFWRQRYRWARGHQDVWRRYHRAVWLSSRLRPIEKVETTLFLLVFHVPVATVLGLGLLVLWFANLVDIVQPSNAFVLWTLLFLGPLLELGGGLIVNGTRRRDATTLIWFIPLLMVSAAVCTKAWIDGAIGRPYEWVKTPRSKQPDSLAGVAG